MNDKTIAEREAVRMLAIELGAREAARRVGVKESTVLSWARRYHWKLPKRKGGAISAIRLQSSPGDALIAARKDLEGATKTALMQTLAKTAQQVAEGDALDVSNTAQLRDICLAAARIFGWDEKPQAQVNINNQVGVICDEATRMRLIKMRESMQAPAMISLPRNLDVLVHKAAVGALEVIGGGEYSEPEKH